VVSLPHCAPQIRRGLVAKSGMFSIAPP